MNEENMNYIKYEYYKVGIMTQGAVCPHLSLRFH